ncbi:hypothetical protein JXA84_04515 [candidate division WOR-3 bacterium]|nr:hypothetical protein [candidate division WOR-3 bacterium]
MDTHGTGSVQSITEDHNKAVSLSLEKLKELTPEPWDYKLIGVEQLYRDGMYVWRTTYKPVSLLPQDPSKEIIGSGGEIFIEVELSTNKILVKYGE